MVCVYEGWHDDGRWFPEGTTFGEVRRTLGLTSERIRLNLGDRRFLSWMDSDADDAVMISGYYTVVRGLRNVTTWDRFKWWIFGVRA